MFHENMEYVRQLLRLRNQIVKYTDEEKAIISKMLDEVIQIKVKEMAQPHEEEYVNRYNVKVFED